METEAQPVEQQEQGPSQGPPAPRRERISPDGRRLLREAVVAQGLDAEIGNKIADWLDRHPNARVSIRGRTPEPPLRVFGTPDVPPRPAPPPAAGG